MPKRVGYLYERMVSLENCIQAEREMGRNKPDNKMARRIANHAEKYGAALSAKLVSGTYTFHSSHETEIKDSYKGKVRHLKIPCLEDQAAMQAWLIVASPYIVRRNYYYNCGSIPGAGQSRAVEGLKRWLKGRKPPKWGGVTDIRKFYDTCPHWVVMRGLRRIFKDSKFLDFAGQMLAAMSGTGVGLAIGFPVSHWLANVALSEIDHAMRRKFPDVKFARYMDDTGLVSRNKRHLHKAIAYMGARLGEFGMELKHTWQVFQIRLRGLPFLSYRFFHGFTLLAKRLMYRIARKMRRAATNMSVHMAQGVMSYIGILKHCDSYNFRQDYVYPNVSPKKCRRLISDGSKNLVRC